MPFVAIIENPSPIMLKTIIFVIGLYDAFTFSRTIQSLNLKAVVDDLLVLRALFLAFSELNHLVALLF
jgi:hypothetical protein